MTVNSAAYSDVGQKTILADINGEQMMVPNEGGNRHRKEIAEWEAGEGEYEGQGARKITPYTPPVLTPSDFDLTDWQLRLGLIANGYSIEAIEATLKAVEDQTTREQLWTFWDRATVIKWDNPKTQQFIAFLQIPVQYAADMWMMAKDADL